MRGGSLSSLAGISTSTALDRGSKIRVLRPLLQVQRRTLRDYAEKQGLRWSEDSTNDKTIFLRNKVRHMLVPYLDEQFSSWWKHAILGYASQIGDAEAALRTVAELRLSAMQRVYQAESRSTSIFLKKSPWPFVGRYCNCFYAALVLGIILATMRFRALIRRLFQGLSRLRQQSTNSISLKACCGVRERRSSLLLHGPGTHRFCLIPIKKTSIFLRCKLPENTHVAISGSLLLVADKVAM